MRYSHFRWTALARQGLEIIDLFGRYLINSHRSSTTKSPPFVRPDSASKGLKGSGSDQNESEALDLSLICLLTFLSEMLSRGVWPYERSPWVWARIADRRLPLADRRALVSQFVTLPFCCSDSGFTARLQSVIKSEEDLLPDGQFHSVLEI